MSLALWMDDCMSNVDNTTGFCYGVMLTVDILATTCMPLTEGEAFILDYLTSENTLREKKQPSFTMVPRVAPCSLYCSYITGFW